MYTILVVVQVLVAIALIALVLLQHGKGADAGAAFGSGASGTVFGARGSANFLSTMTAWLAAAFFAISLALAYFVNARSESGSLVDTIPAAAPAAAVIPEPVTTPALPAEAAPAAAAPATGEEQKPKLPSSAAQDIGAGQTAPPCTPLHGTRRAVPLRPRCAAPE